MDEMEQLLKSSGEEGLSPLLENLIHFRLVFLLLSTSMVCPVIYKHTFSLSPFNHMKIFKKIEMMSFFNLYLILVV